MQFLKMFLTAFLCICLSSSASGFFIYWDWGRCPEVTVKSDFVVDNYLGTWYEIARYTPVPYEEDDSRCTQAVYSPSAEEPGAIKVVNSAILANGTVERIEGIARIPDPNEPAKLVVSFGGSPPGDYWVLDTDYDRYSLVHTCQNILFGIIHIQTDWILSHYRQLDQATLNQLFEAFEAQGVDTDPFIYSNQDGCESNTIP